jgi:hypothetical protein
MSEGSLALDLAALRPEFRAWLQPSEKAVHQVVLGLINTRLFMRQLSAKYGAPLTVDMVSDLEWQEQLKYYDTVWFMGIYQPSEAARQAAMRYVGEYRAVLPDLDPERDVVASPFAIPAYVPNPAIAKDWDAWDRLVARLHILGKQVIIDFVPNHVALDHPWATEHPEYFIQGTQDQYAAYPRRYTPVVVHGQPYYLAHGRDPHFTAWTDTLQLNYANSALQEEMERILLNLVEHADGVRCDMAMLLTPTVFLRTWEGHLTEAEGHYLRESNFWARAIPNAKERARRAGRDNFTFIAEAYWDKDELRDYFDAVYGKELYDDLSRIVVFREPAWQHLRGSVSYLMRPIGHGRGCRDVLFVENHDEERAVAKFGKEPSMAAASLTGSIPDAIFLLNQGQEEGRRKRPPMQIGRFPDEPLDPDVMAFYERLLMLKRSRLLQEGAWRLAPISTPSESIIALHVAGDGEPQRIESGPASRVGAIICINLSDSRVFGWIVEIGPDKDAQVYRLTRGGVVPNPDIHRDRGMFIVLEPWEAQVIMYQAAVS